MFGEEVSATMDVVMESCRTDSGLLQIIASDDGGYRIAVNGQPIACFYWRPDELESCRRTFQRLCGKPDRLCN